MSESTVGGNCQRPFYCVRSAMHRRTLGGIYQREIIHLSESVELFYREPADLKMLLGQKATIEVVDSNGEAVVRKNRKFTQSALKKMRAAEVTRIPAMLEEIVDKVLAEDIVDYSTGEVIAECNTALTEAMIEDLRGRGITEIPTLYIDDLTVGSFLRNTLVADKLDTPEEAILEIYKRLRPGDPPTLETAYNLFNNLFFNPERYDLSTVGRLKLNHKFKLQTPLEDTVLTKRDIVETVRYLVALRDGRSETNVTGPTGEQSTISVRVDDIDHLGNRRVRAVGELMENQYRIGLVRMERAVKERMSMSQEIETLMPHDLVNAKPVSAVVKEYFGSSQLSQFMDQTNPLSEVTHKRRLSL